MSAPRSSFDVVVVGLSVGALAAGALLARRGFRVAVLGHHARPFRYEREGHALYRDLGAVTAHESPAFRRVFAELGLLPAVRRRLAPLDPAWQVVLPRHRIDVPLARVVRVTEVRREFPEVTRAVEEFYDALDAVEPDLDALLDADLTWPPDGFWERRRARALADAVSPRPGSDPFAAFATDHPFRAFVDAQVRFAGTGDPDRIDPLRRVRAHAVARAAMLDGDERDGITRALLEKVLQHGGEVRLRDAAGRIVQRRGRAVGVELSGIEEQLGAEWILAGIDTTEVRRLLRDPDAPPPRGGLEATLRVAALLPRALVEAGETLIRRVRARVLGALGRVVPFVAQHVLWVESPHDGLSPTGPGGAVVGPAVAAEPMEALHELPASPLLGVCGAPLRGDVDRLLLPGRHALPGFGLEGELLSALSAARVITRSDPSKERLRVELWSRVES